MSSSLKTSASTDSSDLEHSATQDRPSVESSPVRADASSAHAASASTTSSAAASYSTPPTSTSSPAPVDKETNGAAVSASEQGNGIEGGQQPHQGWREGPWRFDEEDGFGAA